MEGIIIAIVTLSALIALFPVAYVWYINVGGIYTAIKQTREKSRQRTFCRIDSDCPAGYVCVNGLCVPR